jgi:hypothetical protein
MPSEPSPKRAVAFFDGQNLFHAVKAAFGYRYPNYEPRKLADAICRAQGWHLVEVRLSEVADEIRVIAREQQRWVKIASAFPSSPAVRHFRGVNKTDWIKVDREIYDGCIDPRDYRPKGQQS